MRLSTKGEYATRAVLYLSRRHGTGTVQINEIAHNEGIPTKYLEQILLTLKNAGLLISKKGVKGGYYLARPPEEITVGEVVRVMDGPLAPIRCASEKFYERCSLEPSCGLRGLWLEVRGAISGILDNRTFGDLCKSIDQHQREPMYYI
ncbi:MAG: Rrf2 family transcriptional regulator [Actinobacteria bacterium]|nr:Rrf2 family transcriptional regulator [Actinomycetota bacterium]